ncbi:MAG: MBL fold metallo-hydrolase [Verrucomicrobiia bacterium]|jgi:hydroxyacylglutathione hydrolase
MSLEDHIGDVCRKARLQTGTPIDAAAALAGLTEAQLQEWETEGVIEASVNVAVLAERLGLDAAKAQRVEDGWEPAAVDLSRWRELRVVTTAEGFEVNSFVAWDAASREAAIFDTGWFADDLFRIADENELDVRHLFITHMHGDHVAAIGDVRKRWPEIELHSNNSGAPERSRVTPGEAVAVGGLSVTARLTPGHAEDGVTYVIEGWPGNASAVAIVGDAIFAGSMGKDFSTPELAQQKVRDEILTLPSDTLICPGHGPLTTVGEEQSSNPFF